MCNTFTMFIIGTEIKRKIFIAKGFNTISMQFRGIFKIESLNFCHLSIKLFYKDAVEYFCCASDEISLRTDIPSNEKITESRKSKKACDFYLNNKQDVNAFHVIGGTEVPIEEYPHTVI